MSKQNKLQPYAAGSLSNFASSAFSGTAFDAKGNAIAGTGFKSLSSVSGDAGMIAFSTVVGGASAKLTGGNFWQGVVTGLFVSTLNHAMHKMGSFDDDGDPKPKPKSKNAVRKETVKPSFAKLVEVEGNTLGVVELARDSPMAKFVRGGASKSASISKVLKVGGNTWERLGFYLKVLKLLMGICLIRNSE